MKVSKAILTGFLLSATCAFRFDTGHAESAWPNNKGEICLEDTVTGGFARLAVMRIIGNHFTVNGIVTDNEDDTTLVSGNAEVDGDRILMHLSGSGYGDSEVHGMIGSVQLDAKTLEGFFAGIGFHCDPVSDPDCAFENEGVQPLVPVDCQ